MKEGSLFGTVQNTAFQVESTSGQWRNCSQFGRHNAGSSLFRLDQLHAPCLLLVAELDFYPWVGQGVAKIISGGPQAIKILVFFLTNDIIRVSLNIVVYS